MTGMPLLLSDNWPYQHYTNVMRHGTDYAGSATACHQLLGIAQHQLPQCKIVQSTVEAPCSRNKLDEVADTTINMLADPTTIAAFTQLLVPVHSSSDYINGLSHTTGLPLQQQHHQQQQ
jgi:hypothetical protein